MIWTLLIVGFLLSVFSAYGKNMQATTLKIGRELLPDVPLLPTGLQDAISPQLQTRNNILIGAGWAGYAFLCFLWLKFYIAILVLLGTFFFGVSAVSYLGLVPRPMSHRFTARIRRSMETRLNGYKNSGNKIRIAAAEEVLRRFDSVTRR